jgi:hypothetical protein
MNIQELLKFINIDSNFYNLLKNYEKEPQQYEKELLMSLIDKTKYDKEIIKNFTQNFSNSLILKLYLGKDDKEIFDNMNKTSNLETLDNNFHEIYKEILLNKNVSNGYKNSISISLDLLKRNDKYGHHINDKGKEFGNKSIEEIVTYIKHNTDKIRIEDVLWLSNFIIYIPLNILKNIVFNISEELKILKDKKISENILISYRSLYLKIVSTIQEKYTEESIIENKSQNKRLFNIGKWIIYNLFDKTDDYPDYTKKRKYDGFSLISSFSNIQPHLEILSIEDIEELFELDKNKFEKFLEKNDKIYFDKINFPNKSIYFSSFIKYFKNSEYFLLAQKRFGNKLKEQIEDMKKVSKLTNSLSDRDIYEIKKVFEYRPMSNVKEKYFEDIKENNIEIAKKISSEFGKKKEYYSYMFDLKTNEIKKSFPEYYNKIIKEIFTTDIDLRTTFLLQNSDYDASYPFINNIIRTAISDNDLLKMNEKNHDNSLLNNEEYFEDIIRLYDSMNEYKKKNVLPFIFNKICSKKEINPNYEKFIQEIIKYLGIEYITPSILNIITKFYNEQNKIKDNLFGEIEKLENSNGEINIYIFNKYIKPVIKNYYHLDNEKKYNNSIFNSYIQYLNSKKSEAKEYIEILESYEKSLSNNEDKEMKFLRKLSSIGMEHNNELNKEKILMYYFDKYKNDKDFILNVVTHSYRKNFDKLIKLLKNHNFGNNVNAMEISKRIQLEEIKLEKKKIDNLKLPAGVIPIDNEKRQESLKIIELSLDKIFKTKKVKTTVNEPKSKKIIEDNDLSIK